MRTPVRALLIASTVVAVGLSSYSADPTTTTISGGTYSADTTKGELKSGGTTYSWNAENGDILELTGGRVNINARGTGAGNGIINATEGYIYFNNGSYSSDGSKHTVLNLINSSSIAANVQLELTGYTRIKIGGGELTVNNNDEFTGTSELLLNSGTLNIQNISGTLPKFTATGGNFNLLDGTLAWQSSSTIKDEVIFASNTGSLLDIKGTFNINSNDTINGDISLSSASGVLNVTDQTLNNGKYTQTNGTLNLKNSTLTLSEGSRVGSTKDENLISGGTLNLTNSTLNIQNALENKASVNITDASSVNISTGTLDIAGGTIADSAKLVVESGATLSSSGGSVSINNNDAVRGNIGVSGGDVTFYKTSFTGSDTQSFTMDGGKTVLNNSSLDLNASTSTVSGGVFQLLDSSSLTFNNGDYKNKVSFSDSDTTANSINIIGNSYLDMSGGSILAETILNIEQGATFIQNADSSSVVINNNDTWGGSYYAFSGNLTIKDTTAKASEGAKFSQVLGKTTLDNSHLFLDDSSHLITGGSITLLNNSSINFANPAPTEDNHVHFEVDNASTINLSNGSTVEMTGGTISKEALIAIGNGSTFKVCEGATLNINENDNSSWLGGISSQGSVVLSNIIVETSESKTYFQELNGDLTLNNTSLTLNTNSSIQNEAVEKAKTTLNSKSTLTFNNNVNNTTAIYSSEEGENANTINVKNGSTLTMTNGTINDATKLNLDGAFDIKNGTVTIDNATDVWNNQINIFNGTTTIKGFEKDTGLAIVGGTVNFDDSQINFSGGNDKITAGTLNLSNGSSLLLTNGVDHSLTSISTSGTNIITLANSSDLTIGSGSIIESTLVTINANSTLTNNGASIILDKNTDSIDGSLALTGGSYSISGFEFISDASKTYNQSGGTLTLSDTDLTLNTGSAITDGIINLTNVSNIAFNGGMHSATINSKDGKNNSVSITDSATLTMVGGEIDSNTAFAITEGSTFTIHQAENATAKVTLDNSDNWLGSILLKDGTLSLSGITAETTGAKTFNQEDGTLNLYNTKLNLATTNSIIAGGVMTMEANSRVNFNNAGEHTSAISTTDTSNNTISIQNGSTLNLTGGTINNAANLNLYQGGYLNIQGANIAMDSTNDTWEGALNLESGALTLNNNINIETTADRSYTQNGGTLNIDNASLKLGTTSSNITGGNIYIKNNGKLDITNGVEGHQANLYINNKSGDPETDTASTLNILNDSTFTMTDGSVIAKAIINIENGSENNTKFTIKKGSVELDEATDNWNGAIALDGGTLSISDFATNGAITTTAGTLNINSGNLDVNTNSTIAKNTNLKFNAGTMNINGGSVYFDNKNNDAWKGDISLTSGTLDYTNLTANGKIVASGGTLNVYKSSSGTMTLADDSLIDSNTTFNLTKGAILNVTNGNVYFNSGDSWDNNSKITLNGTGTVDYSNLTTNGVFTGTKGNLNIHSGIFNIINGASIADAVKTTIDQNATLKMTAGTVDLSTDDVWNGDINITSGTLTLNNFDKTTDENSTYTQNKGTLVLKNGSDFIINKDSSITGDSIIKLGTDATSSSTLTFNNGVSNRANINTSNKGDTLALSGENTSLTIYQGSIAVGDIVNIGEKTELTIAGTKSSTEPTLNLNGNAESGNDIWEGTIKLGSGSNYSELNITNLKKAETGVLKQSASNAKTTIKGTAFSLNNENDLIEAGTFNIGDGTTNTLLTIGGKTGDGDVINGGKITDGAKLYLKKNASLDIISGDVNFSQGTWTGDINLNGGTLSYGLKANGNLLANSGNLNLLSNSVLAVNNNSTIKDAVKVDLASNSTINLSGNTVDGEWIGGSINLGSDDSWAGNINNTGGVLTVNGLSNKTGAYTQTSDKATLTVLGEGFTLSHANDKITAGTLNVGNEDSDLSNFTLATGTISDAVDLRVHDNATLTINNGDLTISGNRDGNGTDDDFMEGKLVLNGGELYFNNWEMSGEIVQNGGILNVTNSYINLEPDDSAVNGTINLFDKSSIIFGNDSESNVALITDDSENIITHNAGTLNLTSFVNKGVTDTTNIHENTKFNITAGTINIKNGTVNLNSNDTWKGNIVNSANLNIKGVTRNGGTLTQNDISAVTTVIGSEDFEILSGDNISDGTFNVGTPENTETGTPETSGKILLSTGTIAAEADFNLTKNSTATIDGGTLSIDAEDDWAGKISITNGSLNILDASKKTTDATLILDGGTTTIHSSYSFGANDSIIRGALNMFASVDLGNKTLGSDIGLTINNGTTLTIGDGGSAYVDTIGINALGTTGDSWLGSIINNGDLYLSISKETSGTSTYTQHKGNLSINNAELALGTNSVIDGSSVINLNNGGKISFANGVENTAIIKSDSNENNSINIATDSTLSIITPQINSATDISIAGTANLNSGEITLNGDDSLSGSFHNLGGIVNINGLNKTGAYHQNSDSTITNILSEFTFDNNDTLSKGAVSIADGTTLNLDNGFILADDVNVTLETSSTTLNILGGAIAHLTGGEGKDTVNGSISNSGTLHATDLTLGNSYSHNNGNLILTNSTFSANSQPLIGGSVSLNASSTLNIINGSTENSLSISSDSNTNTLKLDNNSSLTVTAGNILEQTIINIASGSLKINGGNIVIDDNEGSADIWNGTITLESGSLELAGYNSTVGELIATNGDLKLTGDTNMSLTDGSIANTVALSIGEDATLDLAGASLELDSADNWLGTIKMDNSSSTLTLLRDTDESSKLQATKGNLIIDNNSTLNISGENSYVKKAVNLNIKEGSTLNVNNSEFTFDENDTWSGSINNIAGILNFNKVNKTTSDKIIYTQSGGTLNLANNSNLNLGHSSSSIENGSVNLDESTLTVSNGTIDNSSIDLKNNSSFELANGKTANLSINSADTNNNKINLSNGTINLNGGNINKEANVTIDSGSVLNIIDRNANVYLNGGEDGDLSKDTWNGTLTISDGNLTLDNIAKDENAIFQQTGGSTTILGTKFDMNNVNDFVKNGTLTIGDGINQAIVTVSKGHIYDDATLVLKDNASLNILNNGTSGSDGTDAGQNGSVNWAGHVIVDGGELTIAGNTSKTGSLTQSNGTININGTGFDLNNAGNTETGIPRDTISDGTLNINGSLGVSAGDIQKDATVNLYGTLSLKGGDVYLDNDDVWTGLLKMLEGDLTIDGLKTSSKYSQEGGTLTITNDGELTLVDSSITGGTVNLQGSTLKASSNSVIKNIVAHFTEDAALEISNGNGENSIAYNDDGSRVSLTLKGDDTILKLTSGNIKENAVVDIGSGSKLSVANNASITIDGRTDTADSWDGEISLEGGNSTLTLLDYKKEGTSKLTAEQGNFILDGTTELTLTDGGIAEAVKLAINGDAILNLSGADLTLNGPDADGNNADTWLGKINMNDADSTLTLSGMTTGSDANLIASLGNLVLNNSTLTISGDSNISNSVNLNIGSGSTVNVEAGELYIDDNDTWTGVINNKNGKLTINKTTTNKNAETGVLTQVPSMMRDVTNPSITILGTGFDLNHTDDNIQTGTLTIGNAIDNALLTVSKGTIGDATALTISENAELKISGGSVSINENIINDTWNGNIYLTGSGNLSIGNITKNGTLTQDNGNLSINNNFILSTGDSISGGNLTIADGKTLTVDGGTIANGSNVTMGGAGSKIDISNNGVVSINDNNDKWNGEIIVNDSATLNIGNNNKSGYLTQNGGIVNISDNFNLNSASDAIHNGILNVASGKDLTITLGSINENAQLVLGNNLIVNGGTTVLNTNDSWAGKVIHNNGDLAFKGFDDTTINGAIQSTAGNLTIADGTLTLANGSSIANNTILTINDGANLAINGGNATINNGDNWNGNVALGSGSLSINNFNKTTNESSKLTQTGGTLNLNNGSNLTLGHSSSSIEGNVNLNNSTLTVNSGTIDGSSIDLKGGSKFELANGQTSNLSVNTSDTNSNKITLSNGTINLNGGNINKEANVTITSGSVMNIIDSAANVTLDGLTDTWNGTLTISDGNLTLDNIAKDENAIFQQTGGSTTILGTKFDMNNVNDFVKNGTLTIGDGVHQAIVTVSKGHIYDDATLVLKDNASLNILNNGTSGSDGTDAGQNGSVNWAGHVIVDGGELTIAGNTSKTGSLTQSNGTININGTGFDLNNAGNTETGIPRDTISDGTLNINGSLGVSAGDIQKDATVNLYGTLSLNGGDVYLDNDDVWTGLLEMLEGNGNLVLDGINKTGTLTQSAGNTTILKDFELGSGDSISGGTLTIANGELTIADGATISESTKLTINSGVTINENGNLVLNNGDTWNKQVTVNGGNLEISNIGEKSGNIVQNSGNTKITSNFDLNKSEDKINAGNLTIDNNSKLTVSQGYIDANTTVDIKNGSELSVSGGNVTINDDIWSGDISLTNGNLTLKQNKSTNENSKYTQNGSGKLALEASTLTLNKNSAITGGEVSLKNGASLEFNNETTNSAIITDDNNTTNAINIATGSNFNLIGGEISKETNLGIYGGLGIRETGIVTVDNTDNWSGTISLAGGKLILDNVTTAGVFEAQSGTLEIRGSNTTIGNGLNINKGVETIVDSSSTMNISGGNVVFDKNTNSTDSWAGTISLTDGSLLLTDNFKHNTANGTYSQINGNLTINNGAELSLTDTLSTLSGGAIILGNNGTLSLANGASHEVTVQSTGNSAFYLTNNSTYTTTANTNISEQTSTYLENGTNLNVKAGKFAMNKIGISETATNNWKGKINLSDNGNFTLANSNTTLGKDQQINNSMLEQTGGTLSLKNTVLGLYEDTNDILNSGSIHIDKDSKILLASAWNNENISLKTAGQISSVNEMVEANSLGGLIIDNVNGRSDFSIDIYEDAIKGTYTPDTFKFDSITSVNNTKEAVINISDWNLVTNAPGAIITSKTVNLGKIFDTDNLDENVKFTTTAEELITPVSRYKLSASNANDGSYFLEVNGYNKQSFRGQVVTTSQLMNQLVINDILFDRMMLTPQTLVPTNMANKTATIAGAPQYTYSRKDPGLWVKTYGNFENLRMRQDLKVENSAYGSLVGADLGTFELANGWNWIPTIYMGYNGAHQTFEGVSAYENGGQIGAMGTFFNKNWIASLLGYASLYNQEMSMKGATDEELNYYAGTALKTAYNWRVKDHLIIQPSATVSYNFFGGQKWQSAYGQIGMTTGTLNGLNVAPGLNLIWQEDTWSMFITAAYVYNCVGAVRGSAAGMDLPDIWLKRGYVQYGFGASKEITDRLSFFAQVLLRNVGRTGIGFQGELLYKF